MVSCYAFCKNFKRLLSQHLVKFSVSSQNLVMKSQNKSDTHVLRDETTLYLNQKGIIVAGVLQLLNYFELNLPNVLYMQISAWTSDNMKFETFWTSLTLAMENVTKFSSDSHHKPQSTSLVTVYLHEVLTIGGWQSTSLMHSRKKMLSLHTASRYVLRFGHLFALYPLFGSIFVLKTWQEMS